jgi:hypothetical protein
MTGQPNFPQLHFDVTGFYVSEQIPPGFAPTTIIPKGSPFTLSCDFNIGGGIGEGLNNLNVGGPVFEYNVTYYADVIGPGTDYKFPPGPANVSHSIICIPGTYAYGPAQTSWTVPANTMNAGTYKLSCVVKMSPADRPPNPPSTQGVPLHVIGFVEGPMIDIYEP